MATTEETQEQLGVVGRGIRILRASQDALKIPTDGLFRRQYYVDGGAEFPGRLRWITVFSAHTAAAQTNTIRAALAE